MIEPVSYINPRVIGRADEPYWSPEQLSNFAYDRAMHPQYTGGSLIHMPQGWIHSMSSAPWQGLAEGHGAVWTDVLGRVLAERPGHKWILYSGWQMSNAYTIYGRPRPDNGQGFIGEPDWADADNPQHVRMLRDLNLQEWSDRGVTGFVFDSGSKDPGEIVRWRRKLRRIVKTVGLEAIPWVGPEWDEGIVDWRWCQEFGLEYHANHRFRNAVPFNETVPPSCIGRAFVWLVHMMHPAPTPQDVADMMDRGWTPVVAVPNDQLMADAMAIYTAPDPRQPQPTRVHGAE